MGGLVSGSNNEIDPTIDNPELGIEITEDKKRELYDSTDSEISVINIDTLYRDHLKKGMKGKKDHLGKEEHLGKGEHLGHEEHLGHQENLGHQEHSGHNEHPEHEEQLDLEERRDSRSGPSNKSSLIKDSRVSENTYSSRYSREPAEKDENNANYKLKRFSNTSEIRQFFQQTAEKQDMNCYNYMNPAECKAQCGCCNTTGYEQNYENNQEPCYNNQDYPRNEHPYNNYNQGKIGNHSQNYPGHNTSIVYQTHPSYNYPNDPFAKLAKNIQPQQYDNGNEKRVSLDPSKHSRKSGYSYSSPEVMNRYKQPTYYNQNHGEYQNKNERPMPKYSLDEAGSEIDLYKKHSKKKSRKQQQQQAQQRGCPCCHYNYFEQRDDQDSVCSEHSRSTEYMDLAYQQQGDYPNLVDELEDTITQRNKERVQKTLQHFEMISSGIKEPSALDQNEKTRYSYDPCPCQKYKHKNSNQPCYCIKGQCQYCDNYCKKYQQQQQQQQQQQPQPKCDPQCRGNCQQKGYVEKVVRNMDPNLNDSLQKYPKFQNKFNNTHWKFDARSGEWIKVCERNFDYDNNYPPLPPPPPNSNEQMYDNNGERRQPRHSDYINMPPQMSNPHPENFMHHKKNCMCSNCGMHRENRRY